MITPEQKILNRKKSKIAEQIEKKKSKIHEQITKRKNRQKSKNNSTLDFALCRVREETEISTWSSVHKNCFRCSVGSMSNAESEIHIRAKFERYLYWRKFGATVFTEVRWKEGNGRSDLVICLNNGEIFIEEIVCTEKEESILEKECKYPFPIKVIYAKE